MKAIVLLFAVLALLLAGCQSYPFAPANPPPQPSCEELTRQEESPENLSFETIARGSAAANEQFWPDSEPGLLIAATLEETEQIVPYVREEVAAALRQVDFDDSVIVAAFSGSKGQGGWGFCIASITQKEGEVIHQAHLIDSPIQLPETASYYHLIQLLREELPTGEITFNLALTRHEYVNPTGRQRILERSNEEIVTSITGSLP